MPDVGGVASATGSTSTGQTATTKGMSSLSSEDFMKILIAQLQQQDPMNPMSNEAMVTQMSAIRDMEMNYTLTQTLQQMTDEQRFSGAAGLIGKYVKGVVEDSDGKEYDKDGIVTSVRFESNGKAVLELDNGEVLPLEDMTEVHAEPPTSDDEETPEEALKLAAETVGKPKVQSNPLGRLATFGLTNDKGLNLGFTLG